VVDLPIPSPYFWNFLQVFCKSILITKSISSRTKKRRVEIQQNSITPFFKNIDFSEFKKFLFQKIEKIKTQKKPIISDRLAPPPGLEPGTP
jgi:hypothetical protein